MSAFFAAAAASNAQLVHALDYNVEKSFAQFASTPSEVADGTCQSESSSMSRRAEMTMRMKPLGGNHKRATSHLNNEHERIKGIVLSNSFRDPDAPHVPRKPHMIDELHAKIRAEIIADLEEDIQRSILAQQELR